MNKEEVKQVLAQAASEIDMLRRVNEVLQARVDTMEMMSAMVFSTPPQRHGVGMGEDVAWRCRKTINDLDEEGK